MTFRKSIKTFNPCIAMGVLYRILVFGLGFLSILSLLLYFHGALSFAQGVRWLLLREILGLAVVGV